MEQTRRGIKIRWFNPIVWLIIISFFSSSVSGYKHVEPEETFFVEHTVYHFSKPINVTRIGVTSTHFIVDDHTFRVHADKEPVDVTINSLDSKQVNLSFMSSDNTTVFFNVSDLVFTKEYINGVQTLVVDVPDKTFDNQMVEKLFPDDSFPNWLFEILPIIIICATILVVLIAIRP
jgi:hypothetical protein